MKRLEKYLTDKECQMLIDSCKNRPRMQNRFEITQFQLPVSVFKKLKETHKPSFVSCTVQYYRPGDSFSPHKDEIKTRNRTSSMSILLNDNFKGGDLMIEGTKAVMNKGDATQFTPQDLHWVTGIWEGERYVLSVWGYK